MLRKIPSVFVPPQGSRWHDALPATPLFVTSLTYGVWGCDPIRFVSA